MKKFICIILAATICLSVCSGCSKVDYPPRSASIIEMTRDVQPTPQPTDESGLNKYPLRKIEIVGKKFDEQYSVDRRLITGSPESSSFTVDIDFNAPQHYSIGIAAVAIAGEPIVSLSANGTEYGAFYVDPADGTETGSSITEYKLEPAFFDEGKTTLTFTALRGGASIQMVTALNVDINDYSPGKYRVTTSLSRSDSSTKTVSLYEYLSTVYRDKALTAQHCSAGTDAEIDAVFAATGREPALRIADIGVVLGENGDVAKDTEIELAKAYAKKGGLVGFTWLWNPPGDYRADGYYALPNGFSLAETVDNASANGVSVSSAESIAEMVAAGDVYTACALTIDDIDRVAAALLELKAANIPVLFNPVPDGASKVYWWGENGNDYKKLWIMIYERFVEYHQLDNIIWVWSGGSHTYYPGDEYVDIIGESVFVGLGDSNTDAGTQAIKLGYSFNYNPNGILKKPSMVFASSDVPNVDELWRDKAGWLGWALYRGDFVIDERGNVLEAVKAKLDMFYNHDLTVCLDNLPEFS